LPPSEAKAKLQVQIDKGNALLVQLDGWSKESVKARREDYYSWDIFNGNLLRALFTTDEHRNAYHLGLGGRTTFNSLQEEVSELLEDIRYRIREMQNVHNEIDLIPLDASVQTETHSLVRIVPTYGRSSATARKQDRSNKVFIVHGHDEKAKLETARLLQKLNLHPIILSEQDDLGRTIIEKIEDYSDVDFAVVLLTPDDLGSAAGAYEAAGGEALVERARQNVIFEMGFFYGKLGRKNVCALLKGKTDRPTDISGVVYTQMDDHGGWHLKLAKEMKAAGLPVSLNDL